MLPVLTTVRNASTLRMSELLFVPSPEETNETDNPDYSLEPAQNSPLAGLLVPSLLHQFEIGIGAPLIQERILFDDRTS